MAVELKEKDLFQSIFESSVEGILVVDNTGLILSSNPAAEHLFGYDPEELINVNLEILIPEKFKKEHIAHREKFNKNPESRAMGCNLELFGLKKNGAKFPVKISLSPTTIKGEEITIAFITDATELQNVVQELNANKAKDKALLEAIPDMMIIQNYEGDVIDFYVPDQIKLHLTKEEIIGKNIKELVPPPMAKAILKAHNEAIKTSQIQIREYSVNNENVDYEARTVLLNNHSLLTIIRDITEQKKIEQELKDSEVKNKAILDAHPDTIVIHNKEGDMLDILADRSSLLVPPEMFIGNNVKDVFPPDLSTKMINVLSKAHSTNSLKKLITTIPLKDRIVEMEGRVIPIEDDKLFVVLRDITKAKEIEDILNIRNRALEAAGNGIIIADAQQPDNPIIYSNYAFTQITGYKHSEARGRNCRFLQGDDRNQKALGIIKKAIKNGHPCHEVLRNYKKDGTLFWNELTITPVYDDGLLTHFIGVQNDVTQRKREEFLKDQIRVILEMIAQHQPLETIGNTIVETAEGHISDCIAAILMYDQEKGTLHALSAPKLPDSIVQYLEGLKISPDIHSFGTAIYPENEILTTDIAKNTLLKNHNKVAKKHKLKSSWSFPILSTDQDILGTFVLYSEHVKKPKYLRREIIDDITYLTRVAIEQHNTRITLKENREQLAAYAIELEEQVENRTNELKATVQKLVETNLNLEDQVLVTKAAENRAMASQAMFTAIARNFPKGVIVVFNSDFDIVYIDGGELNQLGLSKSELEGNNLDHVDVFSAKRIEQIKENIKKTMDGENLSFEIQFKRRSYSVNTSPLFDDNNNVKWTLFVYNDITKQKLAESEILGALYKEQELNELKSRFISMASHEFRTPLSAILSSAILIEKQNEPGKELKREKYIDQIKTNVRNLVVILNDFLSLSKLEEGKVTIRKEKFDIVQFANTLVDEIESSRKYGQKIVIRNKPSTINVHLDQKLLRHILVNLLSNAIKYSDVNKVIEVVLIKKKRSIVLKVIDQGMGIPAAEQPNLFQRFFRAENSTNIQGTGLGLHIVKQYTELLGGTVDFESVLNKGSTFTVELPIE